MSKILLLKLVDMYAAAQQGCAWEHWVRLVADGEHPGDLGRTNSSL